LKPAYFFLAAPGGWPFFYKAMNEKIKQQFAAKFASAPTLIVRSPGRINLIGEHTDYNNGWVLPASINKAIFFAAAPRTDDTIELFAADLNDSDTISLQQAPERSATKSWVNYLRGIIVQLRLSGKKIKGCNVLMTGDIPLGAGLSSSAAVECGFAFLLNELNGLDIPRREIALMGQRSENQFVGMNCGIMDQFACVFGKEGNVIRLDCRNLDYRYFPFRFSDIDIVLCDTGVKHSFGEGDSEYNKRRRDCEQGVAILKEQLPGISSLRDVSSSDFEKYKQLLPPVVARRCDFIIHEISRVEAACDDLLNNDLAAFGSKMYATHRGLQHDYEVSCEELDFLVDFASKRSEVIGSRMMGGGFGGCTINLVKRESTASFIEAAAKAYKEALNLPLKSYITHIEQGLDVFERV
jgi:galactokinase